MIWSALRREPKRVGETGQPATQWEIEKGLASGSGQADGGVSARVLGTILTWQQEQKKGVFVIATANDVSALPPELLRKGRFDDLFYVDIPTASERAEIMGAIVKRYKRDPEQYDLAAIGATAAEFTGAELEAAWQGAMFRAFNDTTDEKRREPTTADIIEEIGKIVPLARTMGEKLDKLRDWAQKRARAASSAGIAGEGLRGEGERDLL